VETLRLDRRRYGTVSVDRAVTNGHEQRDHQQAGRRQVGRALTKALKRRVAPHGPEGPSQTLDRAGRALCPPLLVAPRSTAHEAGDRGRPESDAKCERDERRREEWNRVGQGGGDKSTCGAAEPQDERPLVAESTHDRSDEASLDHSAQDPECAEEVAG